MVQVDKDGFGVGMAVFGQHSLDTDKLNAIAAECYDTLRETTDRRLFMNAQSVTGYLKDNHTNLSQAEIDYVKERIQSMRI